MAGTELELIRSVAHNFATIRRRLTSVGPLKCTRVRYRLARIWDAFAMIHPMLRNGLVLGVMVAFWVIYFKKYATAIPQEWMLILNFLVLPALLGCVAYMMFTGERLIRLALVSAIPILTVLLVGGDPAKPGLELLLIGPLLAVFWFGASVPLVIQWFLDKRNKSG